jgi:hypothetical protein
MIASKWIGSNTIFVMNTTPARPTGFSVPWHSNSWGGGWGGGRLSRPSRHTSCTAHCRTPEHMGAKSPNNGNYHDKLISCTCHRYQLQKRKLCVHHPMKKQFRLLVGFQVLTATSIMLAVFWEVAPCGLVDTDRCFRDACCLHHQGGEWTLKAPLKRRSVSTGLHGATSQKKAIFILYFSTCTSTIQINISHHTIL